MGFFYSTVHGTIFFLQIVLIHFWFCQRCINIISFLIILRKSTCFFTFFIFKVAQLFNLILKSNFFDGSLPQFFLFWRNYFIFIFVTFLIFLVFIYFFDSQPIFKREICELAHKWNHIINRKCCEIVFSSILFPDWVKMILFEGHFLFTCERNIPKFKYFFLCQLGLSFCQTRLDSKRNFMLSESIEYFFYLFSVGWAFMFLGNVIYIGHHFINRFWKINCLSRNYLLFLNFLLFLNQWLLNFRFCLLLNILTFLFWLLLSLFFIFFRVVSLVNPFGQFRWHFFGFVLFGFFCFK